MVKDATKAWFELGKAFWEDNRSAEESFELLSRSPCSEHLEPLIVALQKHIGESTSAPLEIYEVAKDIVAEINAREVIP